MAAQTGHHFVRINNHEQTDLQVSSSWILLFCLSSMVALCAHESTVHLHALQEYLGSYVSDDAGRLVFQEGLLVVAARQGHWVVLDELNLAPSEVLEALNRCGCKLAAFLWDVPGAAALWPELRQ